ncbi:MAG TPA: hypothetical protein VI932_06920 [Bacteroidota bacterium]|nr:hypothetical protein [Bacteroidota bacterium]
MQEKTLTLEEVMKWAFTGHEDRSPWARLQLDDLLDFLNYLQMKEGKVEDAVAWLEKKLGGTFVPKDRITLVKVLTRGRNTGVEIDCKDVLQFMSDLFHRGSTIPPPWRT